MTLNAKRAAHFLAHSFAIIARLTLLNLIAIICDRRFNLWGNRFIRLSNVPLLTVSCLNRLFITNHTIESRVFALVWEKMSHKPLFIRSSTWVDVTKKPKPRWKSCGQINMEPDQKPTTGWSHKSSYSTCVNRTPKERWLPQMWT